MPDEWTLDGVIDSPDLACSALNDAERKIENLCTALKQLLGISYRLEGCPDPDCLVCTENKRILQFAADALKDAQGDQA